MSENKPAPSAQPQALHAALSYDELLDSYRKVRMYLGALGILLPLGLIIYFTQFADEFKTSISHTYHSPMGGFLVGTLWAIGIFLIAYKDYDPDDNDTAILGALRTTKWDRWIARLAGFGAIGVAVFPVDPVVPDTCTEQIPSVDPQGCFPVGFTQHGQIFFENGLHFISAGAFFICILIFCFFLFPTRPGPKQQEMNLVKAAAPQTAMQKAQDRRILYYLMGFIILLSLVGLVLYTEAPAGQPETWMQRNKMFFWFESFAVWAFAIAWITKSGEYR